MFGITVIGIIAAMVTGTFIILELNWSIKNVMWNWNRFPKYLRPFSLLLAPLCFMPVVLDVIITIGMAELLGASGLIGMMVSMVVCSVVAGYLFYMRRKHNWRYI